jgi:hypothetical protein
VASGVNHEGECPIEINFLSLSEIIPRCEETDLALQLDRDPLPGAKMPPVALRRRGGGQCKKSL